jgi:hypothetical protein
MGGGAAGDASIASQQSEIDRLVFLGAAPNEPADKLKSPSLFIVACDDASEDGPRLPGIQKQYEKGSKTKGANHSRWFCARSVSISNGSRRARDASNPPFPIREINFVSASLLGSLCESSVPLNRDWLLPSNRADHKWVITGHDSLRLQ